MYVKVKDGKIVRFPYSFEDLRFDNPNTSFNRKTSEEVLEEYGAFIVHYETPPFFDPNTQRIKTGNTPILIDGKWTITKTVVELNDEQLSVKLVQRTNEIKKECRRRILAVASETAQSNISQAGVIYTAMRINGVPDAQALAMAGFNAGDLSIAAAFQQWRSAMVDNISILAQDMSLDYNDIENWPEIPDGIEDLAKRF